MGDVTPENKPLTYMAIIVIICSRVPWLHLEYCGAGADTCESNEAEQLNCSQLPSLTSHCHAQLLMQEAHSTVDEDVGTAVDWPCKPARAAVLESHFDRVERVPHKNVYCTSYAAANIVSYPRRTLLTSQVTGHTVTNYICCRQHVFANAILGAT